MALKHPTISSSSGPCDKFMTLQGYYFKIVLRSLSRPHQWTEEGPFKALFASKLLLAKDDTYLIHQMLSITRCSNRFEQLFKGHPALH